MEIGKTYKGYNEDGSSYDFVWSKEMDDKHKESYSLKWVENNDEIRYYLKKEIEKIKKNRENYGFPNMLIDEIQKDIERYEVLYGDFVEMVVLNNNLDVEVYRTNREPFRYINPRNGKDL